MDDKEKEQVLRKFHIIDLYLCSCTSWLCGLGVGGMLSAAIVSGNRNWLWACIPVGIVWGLTGHYETTLRKFLNDPLANLEGTLAVRNHAKKGKFDK